MALNPSGAISLGGPATGQSIAVELGLSPTASISLNQTNVRTLAQVPSGTIIMPTNFWGKSNTTGTTKAIFGFGQTPPGVYFSITNLVSNTGVVASDTPTVGQARAALAAASYGGDKAIFAFGFGQPPVSANSKNTSNLVSNTGVVEANVTNASALARSNISAASYGGDKAIFCYANRPPSSTTYTQSNLISNTGVMSADVPGVGSGRFQGAASSYGGDKAIFAYGGIPPVYGTVSNLVSNTGVVASDTPLVGQVRVALAASSYGGDKGIFAFGSVPGFTNSNIINLLSNTGIIASDTSGVGTPRQRLAATGYGTDKGIFGYGLTPTATAVTNLVSNTGVMSADVPGVGTARNYLAAAGYSTT